MAPPLRITRAGLVGSLIVIVVAATCVRLGFWQLHRLRERRALNARMAARMHAPPLDLRHVSDDTAGLSFRAAIASGSWDGPRTVVLGARSLNGDPGVYLLTPLRLADGGAILVNRGWLPSPDAATVDLRPYTVAGAAQVHGLLVPMPTGPVPPTSGFRRVWFHLDPAALARQLSYPVTPLLLQATSAAAAAGASPYGGGAANGGAAPARGPGSAAAAGAASLPRPLPPPSLDEGPHLGYAIQWFSFATIGLVGWTVLLLRGDKNERERVP